MEEVKRVERGMMEWGIEIVVKRFGERLDIVYYFGDWGKELMIFVFGSNVEEVVERVRFFIS